MKIELLLTKSRVSITLAKNLNLIAETRTSTTNIQISIDQKGCYLKAFLFAEFIESQELFLNRSFRVSKTYDIMLLVI